MQKAMASHVSRFIIFAALTRAGRQLSGKLRILSRSRAQLIRLVFNSYQLSPFKQLYHPTSLLLEVLQRPMRFYQVSQHAHPQWQQTLLGVTVPLLVSMSFTEAERRIPSLNLSNASFVTRYFIEYQLIH